ncbi:MAG: single-stranded-DNA-specific exonuclease RecJ [Candidatus Brocadiae bacterium]|nr:single-stranded-DNA-specific exonuclease RecJ [Candidatus Brocadiia bacterium]
MTPRTRLARRWSVAPAVPERAERLARAMSISPVTAQLLINRGIEDPTDAGLFLRARLDHLHDPFRLNEMHKAVDRLQRALRDNERIMVFGDYDVDGVTGTSLVARFFRALGRPVDWYIPHRISEGYSLSRAAIEKFAASGVKVLVTVDCGTTSIAEVALAQQLGIDVIVTDHHEPAAELPPAVAILNPKVPGCGYPFPGLCGAAMAFKLVWGLARAMHGANRISGPLADFFVESVGLVSLGTVADIAPLVGENRIFATFGLDALAASRLPGLQALIRIAGLEHTPLTAGHIGFRLGPRLNAGGRMGSAGLGVELFLTDSEERAQEIVEQLEAANTERQKIEAEIVQQARERVAAELDLDADPVIVLADDRWHSGVIGIVASKLVEQHYRPTIMIALNGDKGKGSGRSIPAFHLHEALGQCREHLRSFGGHSHAAGLEISRDSVEALRVRINEAARAVLKPEDLVPKLSIDMDVRMDQLTRDVVKEIQMLEPHGFGNPAPVMASANLRVAGEPKIIGKTHDHLSFYVTQGGASLKAIAFGMADRYDDLQMNKRRPLSLAFAPILNEWQGRETVELQVKDWSWDPV